MIRLRKSAVETGYHLFTFYLKELGTIKEKIITD